MPERPHRVDPAAQEIRFRILTVRFDRFLLLSLVEERGERGELAARGHPELRDGRIYTAVTTGSRGPAISSADGFSWNTGMKMPDLMVSLCIDY
jgi:hypothetical protein